VNGDTAKLVEAEKAVPSAASSGHFAVLSHDDPRVRIEVAQQAYEPLGVSSLAGKYVKMSVSIVATDQFAKSSLAALPIGT
jgi:hypothetical protein